MTKRLANITATFRTSAFGFVSSLIVGFVIVPCRVEKKSLQRGCRSSALDQLGIGIGGELFNVVYQRVRRVFQNELAPVLNRDQFLEPPFTNQRAARENSDAIADFLDLRQQMRGQ